jgi:hypothetical protein
MKEKARPGGGSTEEQCTPWKRQRSAPWRRQHRRTEHALEEAAQNSKARRGGGSTEEEEEEENIDNDTKPAEGKVSVSVWREQKTYRA